MGNCHHRRNLVMHPVRRCRFYSPYPVVEMDYERREMAYLALGEYQSGANASSTKFGFTQPVVMQYHTDVSNWHAASGHAALASNSSRCACHA